MLDLHKRLPLGSFFRLIEDAGDRLALANRLLQVYAREQDREMLRDFYYSDDRRVESAVLSLEEASKATVRLSIILLYVSVDLILSSGSDGQAVLSQDGTKVFLGG